MLLLLMAVSVQLTHAQIVRSYIQRETIGQSANGPIYNVSQNIATWVEWSEDGSAIQMLDGTQWRYKGQDFSGVHHYQYAGTSMMAMPGTNYIEAMFSSNFQQMQINYTFGFMGMYTPMVSKWGFIGEGKEAAFGWMDGNY